MTPFSSTSIFSAAGIFGRPGMVMMSPVLATTKPAPEQMTFPAYGITVDTAATILLRDTPDGAIPQTGALKQINNPTPVRISGQETGANDQIWYLVENLNNGDAGYTEAYNVRVVSEQEAMDAVKTPEPTIAPIETPTPEPTEEPTPDPTPEPHPKQQNAAAQ